MAIIPGTVEYQTIFYITVGVVVVKCIILTYLWTTLYKRRGQEISAGNHFLKAVWFLLLTLMLSRLCYMMFDFYYTKFDMNLYYLTPNVYFWQMGQFISGLGLAYIVYIMDKRVMQNKFKGIFALIVFIGAVFQIAYPIKTMDDFNLVSTMSLLSSLGLVIVPVVFIGIARKSSGDLRSTAWMFVFGILLYAIGSVVINAGILTALYNMTGKNYDVTMYYVQALCKVIGLTLFARTSVRFQI